VLQHVELTQFTQQEILLAAEALNTTLSGKRRIVLTADQAARLEDQITVLPDYPGLPQGELVLGGIGYLYNLPVFIDPDANGNYLI
jgi:hypothetical protein